MLGDASNSIVNHLVFKGTWRESSWLSPQTSTKSIGVQAHRPHACVCFGVALVNLLPQREPAVEAGTNRTKKITVHTCAHNKNLLYYNRCMCMLFGTIAHALHHASAGACLKHIA